MKPGLRVNLQQLQQILAKQPTVESLVNIGGSTVLAGMASCSGPGNVSRVVNLPSTQMLKPQYSYKVKIINPTKSDVSVRYLNDCNTKFETVFSMRIKFIEVFQERVPNSVDFNVGYYEGSQQAKIWLVGPEDLKTMYQKFPTGGTITLWCDATCEDSMCGESRKRKREEPGKKNVASVIERDVDGIYQKLLDQHGTAWDTPRLRLWAHCICTDLHQSYDDPPDLPAFKSPETKKHKESLTEALSGAAEAFVSTISGAGSLKSPKEDSSNLILYHHPERRLNLE